jgi:RimJ/RimL family protein N-acetyltransferase
MEAIHIRPLEQSEWATFRKLRLLALQTNSGVFSASYEMATAKSEDEWRNMITGSGHQVFGLFDGHQLIGITGVLTSSKDLSGRTVVLIMSFIIPEYRGRGLSKLFYDARLQWILARPKFSKIIVSHRKSNDASRKANQRCGFRFVNSVPQIWPDGGKEDEVFYELNIPDDLS